MRLWNWFDGWFGRVGTAVGLYQAIPATVVAGMTAYASTGVSWLAALGSFGWIVSGLGGFVIYALGAWLLARSRLDRVEAKRQERVIGEGSPFDPMARVYENKRLYLRDLAPVGRRRVDSKKFLNCEIIGPGTAIIGLSSKPSSSILLRDCNTFDVDCIEIEPSTFSHLALAFWDCDFEGCHFHHMTMLFTSRSNDSLHWITPDFRQPMLIDDKGNSTQTDEEV